MKRRPRRAALALAVPLTLFVLFGMSRVTAPVGMIGVLFDEPLPFAAAAAATSVLGALLLFVRPIELALARVIGGASRAPARTEAERIGALLTAVQGRAGMRSPRLIVRILDDPGANAAAGAGHLLFVTTGALALADEQLEAILAHELGHHRGLHPVLTAVVWWLSLPGEALAAVYRLLRRSVRLVTSRLGVLGRVVAVPLLVVLLVWQLLVMWVYWVGAILAARASRLSEYEADATAARWGYAQPLAAALLHLGSAEAAPQRLAERLSASHPPTPDRVERLLRTG